jgi:hypothetical protein
VSERSPNRVTDADLDRLLAIECSWRERLERRPHWRLYAGRLLCICLAQGGARHLIDGTNGLKDFDVYRVFAASPDRPDPDPAIFRGRTQEDFGPSHFGDRGDDAFRGLQRRHPRLVHRNVDIYSLAAPVAPGTDPVRAIRILLVDPPTAKVAVVARKPVVIIDRRPPRIAWPVELEDAPLLGYAATGAASVSVVRKGMAP